MTQQEMLDQNIRLMMGDLMVQIAMLKVRIAELEAQLAQPQMPEVINPKPNGSGEEAFDGRHGT